MPLSFMPSSAVSRRLFPIAMAALLGLSLSACSGLSLVQSKAHGYNLSEDALQQIRPGQSAALVTAVLGSPQVTNAFGEDTAWYYIGEKVQQTAFGMELDKQRTLLAVYFDKDKRVKSTERLGTADGHVINMDTRRTPDYGQDRTFIESILATF
jgi:outer membrane protein assembly factor BamE (lipoprotein component of BamABCDE complex)